MAKEILCVSEEKLGEVIDVLRVGLEHAQVSAETRRVLLTWCREEEKYLRGSFYKEFWPLIAHPKTSRRCSCCSSNKNTETPDVK